MSKASKKEKKRRRRIAELQRLAAMQRKQLEEAAHAKKIPAEAIPAVKAKTYVQSEVEAEFAHVKTDLIRISVYILAIAVILAILHILNFRYGLLSNWAIAIFKFLGIPS